MGNCSCKTSAAAQNGLGSTNFSITKLPPFTPSTDLFLELGVSLFSRPTPDELLNLWYKYDHDHNDILDVMEFHMYLQAISRKWGDGSWGKAGGGANANGTSSSDSNPSHALLGQKEAVTWEEARSALWGTPVFGVPSPIVLLFQRAFKKRCKDGSTTLTRVEASRLARQILSAAHIPKDDALMASKRLLDAPATKMGNEANQVTLNDFVASVGPTYAQLSPSHNAFAGLDDEPECDLPLGSKIRSFAPVRDETSVEILNCGEAIMSAMLHAVDNATTEIMMSWWEFVPDLPAVRNESLGAYAWENSSGTLPPILKQKAEKGVKVYILLWDIVDIVMPTAPLVEHAIKTLGKLHPNITVISHPGWNVWAHTNHQKFVVVDRKVAIVGGLDYAFKRWDTTDHPLFDPKSAVHPGADLFVNGVPYSKNVKQYFQDKQKDPVEGRAEVAAKTWQDVSVWLKGDAAADVAFNFMQRWNWVRQDTVEVFGDGLRNDMPEIPMQIRFLRRPSPDAESVDDITRKSITPGGLPSPAVLNKECKCQIIRSLGKWSAGTSPAEISHYEAWISAIGEAEDFIYIEQQYLISNIGEGDAKNRVAEAILRRAQYAIESGKPFRIYIVIPTAVEVETVAYFTRRTLVQDDMDQGELCLVSRIGVLLKRAKAGSYWDGKGAASMISVCSLFSADKSVSGRWEVSEVFVHSKCLVVDDRIAVIGSANVNDRSFVGYSDSELGVILWDDGDGVIRDFRLRLWRQYLGLPHDGSTDDLVAEPSCDTAFDMWSEAASDNLNLLSFVTTFTPRDSITSYSQFQELNNEYESKSSEEKAALLDEPERLEGMQGQLVLFPTKFLGDQKKKSLIVKLTESFDLTKPQFL